jgi:hypothetical protein
VSLTNTQSKGQADSQAANTFPTREDMMAAAELDSDFEDDLLEPEPEVPSKKQATAGGSKSTKKTESKRAEQDRIATEFKKASEHSDLQSRAKRAATEAPHVSGTSSPKKVSPSRY